MTDCTLCGLPTPEDPHTDGSVPGTYCCRGCLVVARTLDDPAVADPETAAAAAATSDAATAPGSAPQSADDEAGEPDGTVDEVEGLDGTVDEREAAVAYLSVEGMHCATCEAFLEARAADVDGVLSASANYPAGAIGVTYDPDRIDPASLSSAVEGVGYSVDVADGDGAGPAGAGPGERPLGTEPGDGTAAAGTEDGTGRLLVGGFFGMMIMGWYVLFLYPEYLGLAWGGELLDLRGPAGAYLLGNVWLMATVVLGYTGWPTLRGAYVSLRARQPNMDLLVGVAAVTAYGYSCLAILLGRTEVYFDVATVVVVAVAVGDHYQERVRRSATDRLSRMTAERADGARLRTLDGEESVPVAALDGGDEVVVREGERVPVDGTVREGAAAVSTALLTGESLPERREPGDEVRGGALVREGGLVVDVASDAGSTLDRLVAACWDLRTGRNGVQRLVDRIAAAFVPLVFVLAVGTAAAHAVFGAGVVDATLIGLAVLVVSCPCALGLATPLGIAAGVERALADGVVVTDASVFETARDVDVVAIDKTGTLTTGEMHLVDAPDAAALSRAAAVEQFSDHPVADAVLDAANGREDVRAPGDRVVEDVETHPGEGVGGLVDGERVLVGTPQLFAGDGWSVPRSLRERYDDAAAEARLPALVGWDGAARDALVAADRRRPVWDEVCTDLGEGRDLVVLTGDDEAAAAPFRDHPAVDEVFAGVPPEGKAAVVDRLAERGTVAVVGDGSNDAPALAAADLGIALESGTRLAGDAADVIVTDDDLRAVPGTFALTRATARRVRQNLAWAFCYNAVAVPLAVAGVLNPVFAALAMVTSSLLVVGNSARSLLPDADDTARSGEVPGDGAGDVPLTDAGDAGERASRPLAENS